MVDNCTAAGRATSPRPSPTGTALRRRSALGGAVALVAWVAGSVATPLDAQEEDVRQRVVDLTNAERVRAGLAPLRPDPRLATAAQKYAEFQAAGDCTGHFCDGTPADRARRAGYPSGFVGENWAGGYQTPEDVVAGWMASEGHRANILKPDYQAIGVGMAHGGAYGTTWVQLFGDVVSGLAEPQRPTAAPPLPTGTPLPPAPPAATPADPNIAHPAFRTYYERIDGLRLLGHPISGSTMEGGNLVQYFEKARLEEHMGEHDPNWRWMYGLLVDELKDSASANPVGGDRSTVSYATIKALAADGQRLAPPRGAGGGPQGLPDGSAFVPFSQTLTSAPGYYVPAYFWAYINRADLFPAGWLHDIGLPITPAISAVVDKGRAASVPIMIQAFQRTILTFDPTNPPAWRVERANVGSDYLRAFPWKAPR